MKGEFGIGHHIGVPIAAARQPCNKQSAINIMKPYFDAAGQSTFAAGGGNVDGEVLG